MSVHLAFHFPWKRYHATPWGHYVNEGKVELPPSPWRILRALYSVWKLRAPDLDADTVHGLLHQLAVPPDYTLPPYRLSHTRHYLPDTQHRTGTPSTDLALDAFAILGGDATIGVHWPIDLPDHQHQALHRLAASLPYLGRADSLCEATLHTDNPHPTTPKTVPLLDGHAPHGMLNTQVLAPDLPLNLDALTAETTDTRRAKLLYPPGSRLLNYAVPAPEQPAPPHQRRTRTRTTATSLTTVRFSLHGTPQPRATDTIAVTDALRAATLKALGPTPGPSNLVGKDTHGQPLKGHQHAHYLGLTDNDTLTGLAIWAPGGLTDQELHALHNLAGRSISVPQGVRGPHNLQIRVNAYGEPDILPPQLTTPSTNWATSTPFVPNRWRPRSTTPDDHLTQEINRELAHRGITTTVKITELPSKHWVTYRRHRPTQHQRTNRASTTRSPHGLHLQFTQPIPGPLCLGELSHFGLGHFHNTNH
ncbi:type I-G CRISPR-associated protein Csb2 [Actinomadura fibrosa]|uniref:Type I-U CRISPR-associated protein Csb2 n=1 Tax=Actinomadura fibrosa TaxID=111802 RepID=A0ABW2Y3I9_9ACTN|nr:type I-U CRISPR-associated protein Csb2 [Actinomadura fibrosa]